MIKIFRYDALRCRMYQKHISVADAARRAGISSVALDKKMNGETPFTLDNVYALCEILSIDLTEISVFFPPRK